MTVVLVIAVALFSVAALAALWRIVRGPTVLDRIVASDVLVAIVMCALGAEMALNHHTRTLPVIVVLALFSFVGSLSVARFIPKERQQ